MNLTQVHIVVGRRRESYSNMKDAIESIWLRFFLRRLAVVTVAELRPLIREILLLD